MSRIKNVLYIFSLGKVAELSLMMKIGGIMRIKWRGLKVNYLTGSKCDFHCRQFWVQWGYLHIMK